MHDHLAWTLKRPDVYLGSTVTTSTEGNYAYYDEEDQLRMTRRTNVPFNEGLHTVIMEVIQNALDNPETTALGVEIGDGWVVVTNNGNCISCAKQDLGDGVSRYIPTTIFGVLLSGSKFDKKTRGKTIGMNGIGVKATNIMSLEFTVRCNDPEENVSFSQTWRENMRDVGEPEVKTLTKKALRAFSTQVQFRPDVARFEGGITLEDMIPPVFTRLVEIASVRKNLNVIFNARKIRVNSFKDYVGLFATDATFFHARVDGGVMEMGAVRSPDGLFHHDSFVNGHRTPSAASTHTQFLIKGCEDLMNKRISAMKLAKSNYNHGRSLANSLHVFVTITLDDPKFTPQNKTTLVTPMPDSLKFPTGSFLRFLTASGILQDTMDMVRAKNDAVLNRLAKVPKVRRRQIIGIPKLDDAHEAGKAKGRDAMLFLVEGDSAKTMVVEGMSVIGRQLYGVYPLKGKLLNTTDKTRKSMVASAEIANIIEILGLRFDRTYATAEERETLRYGSVCCMTDADVDGHHITGLIVAFFQATWPDLLHCGYLKRFVTPIVRVEMRRSRKRAPGESAGGKRKRDPASEPPSTLYFFTQADYDAFAAERGSDIVSVRHLKGLGTSKREEAVEYFERMRETHLKEFAADEHTADLVRKIFGHDGAGWRREWLRGETGETSHPMDYAESRMLVSDFLRTEMLEYSLYNVQRSIPSAVDGLKSSQRKIVFACMSKFASPDAPSFKVAQLGALVASMTNYAHGEVSLTDAIVHMAQDFPGSNNAPLLKTDGSFGSRRENGADAASPRYIYTGIRPETRVLFEETEALERLVVENDAVEYRLYYPTLPLVLLNGSNGIATGFRSFVPCFSVNAVITNVLRLCRLAEGVVPGRDEMPLVPYYAGGYKTNDLTRVSEDGSRWIFEGRYELQGANGLVIDEIPIGYSVEGYYAKVLSPLLKDRVLLEAKKDHPDANSVRFEVKLAESTPRDDLMGLLKLRTTENTRVMNLLDVNGRVKNFDSPNDILIYWFNQRIAYLERLKVARLKSMRAQAAELEQKTDFIWLVRSEQIIVYNQPKSEIVKEMVANNFPPESHDKLIATPLSSFTKERCAALEKQLEEQKSAIERYEAMSVYELQRASVGKLVKIWAGGQGET